MILRVRPITWARWFAWRPVWTENQELVWLSAIERKRWSGRWLYRA